MIKRNLNMKKSILLTIIIALVFNMGIRSQIIKDIGIKSGLSLSQQTWSAKSIDFERKKDYRMGLNFALNLEWFDNKYFTLITDIGYIQKGCKEEIMITSESSPETGPLKTYDTRFDYIYFSPQIKVRKEFKRIIPYIFVGPRIDYQLSYKSDFNLSVIENDFEEIIFGLNYGLGIEYTIKKFGIDVQFTNFYDFTDIMNSYSTPDSGGLIIRNNAYTVNIGIKYYLKLK